MTLDYGLLGLVFNTITVFTNSANWIFTMILVMISTAFVTQDIEDFPELLFPVMVGWGIIGLNVNAALYIIAGFLFVISLVTMKGLPKIMDTDTISAKGGTALKEEGGLWNPLKTIGITHLKSPRMEAAMPTKIRLADPGKVKKLTIKRLKDMRKATQIPKWLVEKKYD